MAKLRKIGKDTIVDVDQVRCAVRDTDDIDLTITFSDGDTIIVNCKDEADMDAAFADLERAIGPAT